MSVYVLTAFNVLGPEGDGISLHYLGHEGKENSLPYLHPFGAGNGSPLQCSCLGKSRGQRSLVGYSPWGHKEPDTTERLSTHAFRRVGFTREERPQKPVLH